MRAIPSNGSEDASNRTQLHFCVVHKPQTHHMLLSSKEPIRSINRVDSPQFCSPLNEKSRLKKGQPFQKLTFIPSTRVVPSVNHI